MIGRSPRSRRDAVAPTPYTSIAIRTHVEPPDWSPGRHRVRPTPGAGIVVHSVPRDVPGEPSAFTFYAIVAPTLGEITASKGFLLPGAEPVIVGVASPWDATPEEIDGLTKACERNGLPPPLSHKQFVDLMLQVCWKDRGAFVAFQSPREIGRLQVRWTRAAREPGRGGVVMTLGTKPGEPSRREPLCENGQIEDPDSPRIVILPIDAKRARIWFKPVFEVRRWNGVFVSLQPLAEALSGQRLESVADACEVFEVDYPPRSGASMFDRALTEVRAECLLYRALLERHVSLCPDEPPAPYVSAGTYAKAVMRKSGLRPPLQRWVEFPREVLAATMAAYHAGALSTHVRGTKLPARLLDFGGAFGIAGILAGAWDLMVAENVSVEEISGAEAARLLETLASEFDCFVHGGAPPSQEAWQAARLTVYLEPIAEVLPHRPRHGEGWISTRAPLTYRKGVLPWQAPDVIVHLLEGGEMPEIVRAFRLVPNGRVSLREVKLPTGRTVNPSNNNLIRILRDERVWVNEHPALNRYQRRRLSGLLKGLVVSLSSGLTIQMNDDEPTKTPREQMVFDPRTGEAALHPVNVLETPGDWY